jgi:hypothetical protein
MTSHDLAKRDICTLLDSLCPSEAADSEESSGAPDQIEVTTEMAAEGARVLADRFESAIARDWLTQAWAAEVYRAMVAAA